ncbi:MAG: sulfite exporter TauE/SafE family protein [Candidatus Aeolococcus gillhamiae]|uniref:Probable membrane transporter protein n=1 Tax=Candidatus Aeolococcus gillhamiae TaxID=3127015 RepID=A0A2W6A589_9BACT|nr:MAG: sulfite exporter TauE/SafE family protein [Candidatus Dormibacter sp. RRmetagenome_bin12]
MHLDLTLALAGLIVGFVVGLTGMGGGALMTPILVVVFNVQPLAAVSSDLVASFFMRPVGALVHLRQGTVNRGLVKWLVIGSVPSAFVGVLILRAIGRGHRVESAVQIILGVALLVAAGAIVVKALLNLRQRARGEHLTVADPSAITVRPVPTMLIGALGGLVVGMTSVGSGSLIIVLLLFLYPRIRASQLVGTDLVQAIPLVGAASLGHLLFGDFRVALTASLLVGSIPGVYLGARISARAPARLIRRVLAFVLLASGLKLVQVGNVELGVILLAVVVIAPVVWMLVRATDGLMPRRARAQLVAAGEMGREQRAN